MEEKKETRNMAGCLKGMHGTGYKGAGICFVFHSDFPFMTITVIIIALGIRVKFHSLHV